jgi:hypothetical protein
VLFDPKRLSLWFESRPSIERFNAAIAFGIFSVRVGDIAPCHESLSALLCFTGSSQNIQVAGDLRFQMLAHSARDYTFATSLNANGENLKVTMDTNVQTVSDAGTYCGTVIGVTMSGEDPRKKQFSA